MWCIVYVRQLYLLEAHFYKDFSSQFVVLLKMIVVYFEQDFVLPEGSLWTPHNHITRFHNSILAYIRRRSGQLVASHCVWPIFLPLIYARCKVRTAGDFISNVLIVKQYNFFSLMLNSHEGPIAPYNLPWDGMHMYVRENMTAA